MREGFRRLAAPVWLGIVLGTGVVCGEPIGAAENPPAPSIPLTTDIAVSHVPADPSSRQAVTITAVASGTATVVETSIVVGGAVARVCAGAQCSHEARFPVGSHSYAAVATDAAGRSFSSATHTFAVRQPAGTERAYSPTSPHWRHMRTATIDYRIHYQPPAQRQAEYDWAAAHFDHVTGGDLNEYKKRNPTIQHYPYDTFWFVPAASAGAAEGWLTANGYDPEHAYLHQAGTAKTKASRVTAQQYANRDYWYYNMADPGFRAWREHRTKQLTGRNAQGHRSDGLFLDTNNLTAINNYIPETTLEYASRAAWLADHDALLAAHRDWVPSGFVVVNLAQYFNRPGERALAGIAGGVMTEFVNGPFRDQFWNAVDALVAADVVVEFTTTTQATYLGNPRNGMTPGNYSTITERMLMWMYAGYLMVVDPANMDGVLFEPYIGGWTVPMSTAWLEAFEYDIGLAVAPRRVYKSGTDMAGQPYVVFSREFENGLVLIRPRQGSYLDYGDNSVAPVELPAGGPWRMLHADGSPGDPRSTVEIRLGESVILIR